MRRFLDYDPVSKIRRYFHWNDQDETFSIEEVQDVGLVVEDAKHNFLAHDERAPWTHKRSYDAPTRVASLPLVVWQDLVRRGVVAADGSILDEPAFKRWLNDADNKAFRTRPGRV